MPVSRSINMHALPWSWFGMDVYGTSMSECSAINKSYGSPDLGHDHDHHVPAWYVVAAHAYD